MTTTTPFDVLIIGGSYSGLAAGMALGRALKKVLIIDSGLPCNRQTPYSHNFLTHDGSTPKGIATLARQQVEKYDTIQFFDGLATKAVRKDKGFEVEVDSGETFAASKVIFATGVRDLMPAISGFAECWGISVLHCPYCHGYEVRNERTGILSNGEQGFEFSKLISNWTQDLTLYTNGHSTLTSEQTLQLRSHGIEVVEKEIEALEHVKGYVKGIRFKDGSEQAGIKALYAPPSFEQHCPLPASLGCEFTEEGYIKIDGFQKTSVSGVFASGDATTRMRTVANAVATGTFTGIVVNKELVWEQKWGEE